MKPWTDLKLRFSAIAATLVLLAPLRSVAQNDVEKPLPNVLLLVDTSGSMEFKAEEDTFPRCNPGSPTRTNEKSRWIDLIEVMTGTFEEYSCFAQSRASPAFVNEFSFDGRRPYDADYVNPHHRVISNDCVVGPGVPPPRENPYSFPQNAVQTFAFSPPSTVQRPSNLALHSGCSGFRQAPDGILDVFREKVRFGLMTFDTHVHGGTGLDASNHRDAESGMQGTWSYFIGEPVTGRPEYCLEDQIQEVGARNPAAPPWEGRMVAFGPPDASGPEIEQRNEHIQKVLLSTRPYGATPIAGLLSDARDFLWYDTRRDPLDDSATPASFGPYDDPHTRIPNCRRNLIILLSDGEPNLDLRPYCENVQEGGRCPYSRPEDIVSELLNNPPHDPDQFVETVVVGFGMSRVTPAGSEEIPCSELTDDHCRQNPTDRAIQACCTLNKIAASGRRPHPDGGDHRAHFPQNSHELRRAFSRILSDVTTNITTRTAATFASAQGTSQGGSFQFSSSFQPVLEQPWKGQLTRTRIVCQDGVPKEQPVETSLGDDFAANLNSGIGPARRFSTFIPDDSARDSVRPHLSANRDGLGVTSGRATGNLEASSFVTEVPVASMEVDASDCAGNSATACRDAILTWTVGLTNADGETRCRTPGSSDCNLLGAIFHATPTIVSGAPGEFLRDESYDRFVAEQAAAERPSVLYAVTVDGMLHAFKVAPQLADPEQEVTRRENNELWAFIPPAVLPVLQAQYPTTPATLLDGTPIIRDVVAKEVSGRTVFERSLQDAQQGAGNWKTVLVAGFGKGQVGGGYYALDVTDPDPTTGGPEFLWQLTRDGSSNPLFGSGGTPLITTLFVKSNASDPGAEVPVAVLPGGDAGTRSGAAVSAGPLIQPENAGRFGPDEQVNGYVDAAAARSLTIVRLDTGEVLRSFRSSEFPGLDASRTTIVDIPAPIVGQPAAFPGAAGAVADRIFIGDREGRLWRLDVSDADPSRWKLEVFFDLYYGEARERRQPLELAPVLSVDEMGQVTIAAATGDQRVQSATPGMLNRIVSLTEKVVDGDFIPKVNWVEELGCTNACGEGQHAGERVTGPMNLLGSSLYFATTAPASGGEAECSVGASRVWGVHYLMSKDAIDAAEVIDPLSGAAGALPSDDGSLTLPKSTPLRPGVVFGVSIEQQPSCSVELEQPIEDVYVDGYGQHISTTAQAPSKFFLVFQIGGSTQGSANKVATEKLELAPPEFAIQVDSWAPIFE